MALMNIVVVTKATESFSETNELILQIVYTELFALWKRERGNKGVEREFCPFELLRWIPSPLSLPCYIIHCNTAVRHAVGVEVILGALSFATRKSPKELHVLDAGIHFVFRVL